MKSYNVDLRSKVIKYYRSKLESYRKIGKIFSIGASTICRWIMNGIIGKKYPKRETKFSNKKWLLDLVEKEPMLSLKEICSKIEETFQILISRSTLSRYLSSIEITHKKVKKITKTIKNTEEIKDRFKKEVREIGYEKILSFDETGFQLDMCSSKGWSKKGEKCYYEKSRKGHENWTGIFLISTKGIEKWWLRKKGIDKEKMISCMKEIPENLEGKTIVLDNLRVHHNKDVKETIEKKKLKTKFTPPYSPELNPVEEVFSWIKRKLRKIVIKTGKELEKHLEKLVEESRERELLNYFKHSYE